MNYKEAITQFGNAYKLSQAVSGGLVFKLEDGIYSTNKQEPELGIIMKKYPKAVLAGEYAFYAHGLTNLIPEILQYVDEGRIAFTPAVELSYLDKDTQEIVLDAMEREDCTPSYSQTVRMKKLYNSNLLDEDTIYSIMAEEKANQREKISFHVNDLREYFPRSYTASQMSREILQALEERRGRIIRERERDRDDR